VFENVEGDWEQLGSSLDGETMLDEFGGSLAISANGRTLAVTSREGPLILAVCRSTTSLVARGFRLGQP